MGGGVLYRTWWIYPLSLYTVVMLVFYAMLWFLMSLGRDGMEWTGMGWVGLGCIERRFDGRLGNRKWSLVERYQTSWNVD